MKGVLKKEKVKNAVDKSNI